MSASATSTIFSSVDGQNVENVRPEVASTNSLSIKSLFLIKRIIKQLAT
jgi:hypothetical protein